jgi:hypothetical protein
VDVGAAGRANFGKLHPFIFGEVCGNDFVGVFDVAGGGKRDGCWHGDDVVGLRNDPAGGPVTRWRSVARIACGSARVDPRGESRDFLCGERRIVGEMPAAGISEPRRHDAARDVVFDLRGEAACLRVGDERHGCNFAGTMTGLAVLLEDGKNIFVECWRR